MRMVSITLTILSQTVIILTNFMIVETVGGVRVGEDDEVMVGKNDVSGYPNVLKAIFKSDLYQILSFKVGRA